jgi:hypothetical protein
MDSNFQYASTVRWHRATDLPREAALPGAPASHDETAFRGAAGFREARRRHAVRPLRNPAGRKREHCNTSAMMATRPLAVRAAATVRPAATAPSPTEKSLPLAPAGTASNFT